MAHDVAVHERAERPLQPQRGEEEGVAEDEAGEAVGVAVGDVHADRAAPVLADQHGVAKVEVLDELADDAGEVLCPVPDQGSVGYASGRAMSSS